ncbi:hypothetical protein ACKVWC_006032 [Pyricularia oryzae]
MAQYSNGYSSAFRKPQDDNSIIEELRAAAVRSVRFLWRFTKGPGRVMAINGLSRSSHQLKRNLVARRILSFPHLLVVFWVIVLLWGERWVFHNKVNQCHWDKWEKWPPGANPHHLVLVADPQLIDPHSYPSRPWPLNPLTYKITDNYLRRSYNQLISQLDPTSLFFLGDLFDGGREWKTAHGEFKDPEWNHRPNSEKGLLKKWYKKYTHNFWLKEYGRFGNIFFDPWVKLAQKGHVEGQRGRKMIANLPGNHDLGFGDEIKIPVRDRFETYFGEGNRVDVIGNHTFVSVDTVSLSADKAYHRIEEIYKPTEHFLKQVGWAKRKAVVKELRHLRGEVEEVKFWHRIEDLEKADFTDTPKLVTEKDTADFPTILLTHVPLYRPPGTPCGPLREHWPPAKPPKGQTGPVIPDHRNAISVSGGYQYQNVLDEEDSKELIRSIGNVVHAFSGDDHDYCEVVHSAAQDNVKEITVKSISMAMGVPTPGFLLVSLYNPIDTQGKPLPGAPKETIQTHLCLLPSQLGTFSRYGLFAALSGIILAIRAFLVPVLGLTPFALEPQQGGGSILPIKAKMDDAYCRTPTHDSGTSSFQSRGYGYGVAPPSSKMRHSTPGHRGTGGGGGKWGWGSNSTRTPKIEIHPDDEDDHFGKWKAARSRGGRQRSLVVFREFWTTAWRCLWMVAAIWAYLTWKG